jgi:hypothetical protein
MTRDARYLSVENPDNGAEVEFLSENVSLTATIINGKLEIVVKMTHGSTAEERENSSTWLGRDVDGHLRDGAAVRAESRGSRSLPGRPRGAGN